MRNFVQEGRTLPLTAPYAVPSGGGMLVGLIFGVANYAALQGETVETDVVGVHDLLAEGSGSGQDLAVGAAVYWDDTNKRCTKTVGTNTKIGVTTEAKLTAATTVRVRLNGTF